MSAGRGAAGRDTIEIPSGFPQILLPALPEAPNADGAALITDPAILPFWQSLAAHVPIMTSSGWDSSRSARELVRCVLFPLDVGFDFHGTLPRLARDRTDMGSRRNAASLARELAKRLDELASEFSPPVGMVDAVSLFPLPVEERRRLPRHFRDIRVAEVLRRLADELEVPPDFTQFPGLASQKASWRGYIREVQWGLGMFKFTLRERDAVAIVARLALNARKSVPSREAVRDALRPLA